MRSGKEENDNEGNKSHYCCSTVCAQPKPKQEIFESQQLEQNPIGHQELSEQRSDADLEESRDTVTCEAALSDGMGISNVNAKSEEVGDRDIIHIQTALSQTEFEPSQRPTRDIRRPSRFQDEMFETRLPALLRRPMYFNSGREVPSSNTDNLCNSHLLNATPSQQSQQGKPVRRDKKKIRRICSDNGETASHRSTFAVSSATSTQTGLAWTSCT